ncbi:MAG: sensor histidine kinase [Clostridia bacterium]|nr:sensor histidine kinase [Clostridia bacterium]
MEYKGKIISNPARFTRVLGVGVGVVLLVFEVIICAQYVSLKPMPAVWKIVSLVGCSVALDVLCLVELYAIKTLKARIAVYCVDFVFLLFVCALTGSTYISALYCVILSQFYINIEDFKTKIVAFVLSCVMFIVTCVVGWFINQMREITYNEIFDMVSAWITGVIILAAHFGVVNFLIGFYRTNIKLTGALKEADESKKQLEEAYAQLSETAVFQERNRIARDIHDNAGHSITAVIMQTEAAKLLIDVNPEEAKAKVISANIQAKNALDQMRESVHLLAGRDSSCSLKEELEEILAQTMDGTGVKIRCAIDDVQLAGVKRRFIANSLKECLANGMRHGGASAFYVELSSEAGVLCLTVSDNGCGLPDNFKEGFGLRGIREKAVNFGGGIVYESESGDGCEIKITINAE